MNVTPTTTDHIPDLRRVISETGLFPDEMLADMIAPYLAGQTDEIWLTCTQSGGAIGFCYARPEDLTDGTWNLLAIAVHPSHHRSGAGRALVRALEDALALRQQRLVIVDTSGTAAFAPTRAFYRSLGYEEEARIRDFWAAGDDKVTFRKIL